jgi:hypothetical protein
MEDSLQDAFTTGFNVVADFLPKLVLFLVILIVAYLVAKALATVVGRLLHRVGFDRAVERGGVGRTLERSDLDASTILGKVVFYAVLLFGLQLAFNVFGPNPVSAVLADIIAFLPQLFIALVIIVVAAAIASGVKSLVADTIGGLTYGQAVANAAGVLILALGVIAALNQVGIATTVTTPILIAFLASIAGVVIVGIGGGLIRPMQSRWESWLQAADRDRRQIRGSSTEAPPATTPTERSATLDGSTTSPLR